MALVVATLTPGVQAALAAGATPNGSSSDVVAVDIATSYDAYARLAQSCSALPPTIVKLPDLKDKLKTALSNNSQSAATAADLWAQAFEAYWTGAFFGATGTVITINGTAALKSALESIFSTTSNTLPGVAQQVSTELDKFSKLVMVKDTAVPPPSGCGPSPIS